MFKEGYKNYETIKKIGVWESFGNNFLNKNDRKF